MPDELCTANWGSHGCYKHLTQHGAFHKCTCGHWILTPTSSIREDSQLYGSGIDDIQFGIDKSGFVWHIWYDA